MRSKWTHVAGVLFAGILMCLPALGQERDQRDEGARRRGGRGGWGGQREQGEGGRGQGGGRQMMQRMQEQRKQRTIESIPESATEFERHEKVQEELKTKHQALREEIRKAMQEAEGDRDKVFERFKDRFAAVIGEQLDEELLHQGNLLDLRKANRDAEIASRLERMSKGPRGRQGGGDGQDGRQKRGRHDRPMRGGEEGQGGADQPTGAGDDMDLIRELDKLLE